MFGIFLGNTFFTA